MMGCRLARANACVAVGEPSVLMTLPIDMKKLDRADGHDQPNARKAMSDVDVTTYPNVAADPIMYWPSVRVRPLGPAPNRMIFTPPIVRLSLKDVG